MRPNNVQVFEDPEGPRRLIFREARLEVSAKADKINVSTLGGKSQELNELQVVHLRNVLSDWLSTQSGE